MDAVFKKMNYKNHKEVFVLNAPDSFIPNTDSISDTATIKRKVNKKDAVEFAVCFASKEKDLSKIAASVGPQLEGDAILWICYPKKSSKKYQCDFNRDSGWEIFGQYDLEGVRQVAIDEDWSALRFRKIEYIKNFKRNEKMALSKEGKSRAKTNNNKSTE